MEKVAVLMGSQSDTPIVQEGVKILQDFGAPFEWRILSAHRTPQALKSFVLESGCSVFIAAAGKAAHLAGVIASLTTRPIIALPILTSDLGGLDSLLSSVQMPKGIPVACVGINAASNAALLALQILALNDPLLAQKLTKHRQEQESQVLQADLELQRLL
ncbi:5-(carboxyamino)imidazole ribonucleotide mutase [Helicobacter mehlei]|uniref:N5-carboxyaminoimidazole ribonucleotide mutase n=1 Tax=Helicobacter mehlei TaxID=2316080 RepID=A0A553UNI4_9HELI|nr:5-(carboxyamino)imidazole ribonucleotide mutase [Helicobacter mehlei]TSA81755.1 5-(carboxyamino)imidazole ribonucleotide mutase [Helicobacter mehlei]